MLDRALSASGPVEPPLPLRLMLRLPGLRDVPARIIGVRRVRVEALPRTAQMRSN